MSAQCEFILLCNGNEVLLIDYLTIQQKKEKKHFEKISMVVKENLIYLHDTAIS